MQGKGIQDRKTHSGQAASPNPILGWVGSLSEIERTSGYWIKMDDAGILDLNGAIPSNPDIVYDIHSGANLISYPSAGTVGVSDALPDDIEYFVEGIITEGGATTQIYPGNWIGSLTSFIGGMGYWVVSSEPISFIYDLSTLSRTSHTDNSGLLIPNKYKVHQSTRQAFYFIRDIIVNGEPITNEDWIVTYHNEVVIGARRWNGSFTDVPAMGSDENEYSLNYAESGVKPSFKLYKAFSPTPIL